MSKITLYAFCPDCGGDGVETCHNPDHGFIGAMSFHEVGRLGCPVCGHHPEGKVRYKGEYHPCDTCGGDGVCHETIAIQYMNEYHIDNELEYII